MGWRYSRKEDSVLLYLIFAVCLVKSLGVCALNTTDYSKVQTTIVPLKGMKDIVQGDKKSTHVHKTENIPGIAAEWERDHSFNTTGNGPTSPPTLSPANLVETAVWYDEEEYLWLYGGRPVATEEVKNESASSSSTFTDQPHYVSDLWRFETKTQKWSLQFTPEAETRAHNISGNSTNLRPSTFPDNLGSPMICGSRKSGKIAVIPGLIGESSDSSSTIWMYHPQDVNGSLGQKSRWTSYICKDGFKSDGNKTGSNHCPIFSKRALLWCADDGIMLLQPAVVSMPPVKNTNLSDHIDLWKFDIDAMNWRKQESPIKLISATGPDSKFYQLLQTGTCRSIPINNPTSISRSNDSIAYIVCHSPYSPNYDYSVFVFDSKKSTVTYLDAIHRNTAFSNENLRQSGESRFYALDVSERNITVMLASYGKLLETWIHDHFTGKLYSVNNTWEGSTLKDPNNLLYNLSVKINGSTEAYSFVIVNTPTNLAQAKTNGTNAVPLSLTITLPNETNFLQRNTSISLPTTPSPNLLERLELHRRQKYRADLKSIKQINVQQKRIPGGRLKGMFSMNLRYTKAPTAAAATTIQTQYTTTFQTSTALPSKINTSFPAVEATKGIPAEATTTSNVSTSPRVTEKAESVGRGKLRMRMKRKRKPVPQNLMSNPINVSPLIKQNHAHHQQQNNIPANLLDLEILPIPQKLMKPSSSLLSFPEMQQNGNKMTSNVAMAAITKDIIQNNSSPNTSISAHDGLEARKVIQNDHHIHNPGSMVTNRGYEQLGNHGNGNKVTNVQHHLNHHHPSGVADDSVSVDPLTFFGITLTFFASIGVVVFVQRCVKCPSPIGDEEYTVFTKESLPGIRYSVVIPGDVPFHTPLV